MQIAAFFTQVRPGLSTCGCSKYHGTTSAQRIVDPYRKTVTNPDMDRLSRVMNLLRTLDEKVPAQVLACLFYIASRENCHKTAMELELGLPYSSSSRNIARLSPHHRLTNKDGMDLIIVERDPLDRKRYQLRLNSKGQRLIQQIQDILYGPQDSGIAEEQATEGQDQDV